MMRLSHADATLSYCSVESRSAKLACGQERLLLAVATQGYAKTTGHAMGGSDGERHPKNHPETGHRSGQDDSSPPDLGAGRVATAFCDRTSLARGAGRRGARAALALHAADDSTVPPAAAQPGRIGVPALAQRAWRRALARAVQAAADILLAQDWAAHPAGPVENPSIRQPLLPPLID